MKKNIYQYSFDCTGCSACEQICPRNAISFVSDAEGFLVPHIEERECVDCGICVKVCPQLHEEIYSYPQQVLAAYENDEEELLRSTSGGAFYAMAKSVINRGGSVFGCVFDKNLKAVHIKAETTEELLPMRGSKYVQSDVGDTFAETAKVLNEGKEVLYTGTPCQIAGLLSFLRQKRTNTEYLCTVDLVCHGVPSPGLFQKYIEWYEKKNKCKVTDFEFRCKEKVGWNNGYYVNICKDFNTKDIHSSHKDMFEYAFLRGKIYRESCYKCKYASISRVADITIADYWGIEKEHPEFFNYNGVSLILVNTERGDSVIKETRGIRIIQSDIERARKHNKNLNNPMPRPIERNTIYKGLNEDDIDRYFNQKFKIKLGLKEKIIVSLPISLLLTIRKIKRQWER